MLKLKVMYILRHIYTYTLIDTCLIRTHNLKVMIHIMVKYGQYAVNTNSVNGYSIIFQQRLLNSFDILDMCVIVFMTATLQICV